MRILVTNDDGIHAPGLIALAQKLSESHDVIVVAPDREQSGVGHGISVHQPLRVAERQLASSIPAYEVSGTPADCVKLALDRLVRRPVDLVVSGINDGANLGTDVLYSGTVAGAVEGAASGTMAMAVSLVGKPTHGWRFAAEVAEAIAVRYVEEGLARDALLNVNVPGIDPADIRGIRVTRLGIRRYKNVFERRVDPRGREYYWLAGEPIDLDVDQGDSDAAAIADGFVSVTPIHFDLTEFKSMDAVSRWNLRIPD